MEIKEDVYGTNKAGDKVRRFKIRAPSSLEVHVINYGATITFVGVPSKDGAKENVALCHQSMPLMEDRDANPYFGATCGRVANISNPVMQLEGEEYQLATNFSTGKHHLHGGQVGYDQRMWDVLKVTQEGTFAAVELKLLSHDGEEGYPGWAAITCIISLSCDNVLGIQYQAAVQSASPINLTNHCYWALHGGKGDTLHQVLTIPASSFIASDRGTQCPKYDHPTPVDSDEPDSLMAAPREGGVRPMDFRQPQRLGDLLQYCTCPAESDQVGWNHSFVLDGQASSIPATEIAPVHGEAAIERLQASAVLHDPRTGRTLTQATTQPCCHLYTSNYWDGSTSVEGIKMERYGAVCLETQYPPDSMNRSYGPKVPRCIVEPGQRYDHLTVHKFTW